MIKQFFFAAAAFSAAMSATLAATGPALAQTVAGEIQSVQLTGAMRSVSLIEAMADASHQHTAGQAGRPVHGVMVPASAMTDMNAAVIPSLRLAMLDRFATAEQRLTEIMIAPGVDIIRPRQNLSLSGRASDDHDFGNIGFSEVDAFHTDPSPSQIGLRFNF